MHVHSWLKSGAFAYPVSPHRKQTGFFPIRNDRKMKHLRSRLLPFIVMFVLVPLIPAAANSSSNQDNTRSPLTIVFFGDSLTAGYGIDPDDAYPALIEKKARESGWHADVINAGLSGETSAAGARRVDWILRRPVDVFVLELGGNDGLRGLDVSETERNLQTIVDRVRARYPDAQIMIAGMMVPPNMGEQYAREFAQIFPRLAEKNHAALIPFLLEGVGGEPELNLPDGVHPTAEGHRIVAETVWETLEPLLRNLREPDSLF